MSKMVTEKLEQELWVMDWSFTNLSTTKKSQQSINNLIIIKVSEHKEDIKD